MKLCEWMAYGKKLQVGVLDETKEQKIMCTINPMVSQNGVAAHIRGSITVLK